jgi:hypothetical protein
MALAPAADEFAEPQLTRLRLNKQALHHARAIDELTSGEANGHLVDFGDDQVPVRRRRPAGDIELVPGRLTSKPLGPATLVEEPQSGLALKFGNSRCVRQQRRANALIHGAPRHAATRAGRRCSRCLELRDLAENRAAATVCTFIAVHGLQLVGR